jgi:hypothetical protein
MNRRRAIVALALGAVWPMTAGAEAPNRGPPGENPADRDPRLTALARSAEPIIAAIERFRAANRHFPSIAEAAALDIERVKGRNLGNFAALGDWLYYPEIDGSGYRLSRKLGWDARLLYQREGTAKRWAYDPGDGSEQKEIVLEP